MQACVRKKKNVLLIDGDDIVHQTPENFAVLSECYHNKPNGKFKEWDGEKYPNVSTD